MVSSDRFARDKATIRAALEQRARAQWLITYGEAAQGLSKIGDVSV